MRSNLSFDYEAKDLYRIEVTSRDAGLLPIVRQFDITINDLNTPGITAQPRYDLRIVADIDNAIQSSNPESALQLAGLNYFVASTPTFGKEMFRTDLTIGGTSVVKDLVTGTGDASPQSLTVFGNRIFFVANYSYIDPIAPPGGPAITKYGLWKTDGTEVGTELVKDLGLFPMLPTSAKPMVVTNNLLLFFVGDNSSGEQLWATNGSAAGTQLIKTFNPGFAPISTSIPTANTGSLFYFNRNVDTLMGSHELWRTDGTAAGTFLLRQSTGAPLGPSNTFDPSLVAVGNKVFFVSANFSEGLELWKSDGSVAGTALFKDINFGPMGAAPTGMTNVNGTLYFSADDGAVGRELWKSDGTTVGTVRVKDILTGTSFDSGISGDSATSNFTSWNNKLYFVANNGINGTELWTSDGTSTGTQMVFDAGIGSQSLWPSKLVPMSTQMLIVTSPFGLAGQQLWVTDGTSTGTTVLSSSSGVSQSTSFFVAGYKAYFQGNQAATGNELGLVMEALLAPSSLRTLT